MKAVVLVVVQARLVGLHSGSIFDGHAVMGGTKHTMGGLIPSLDCLWSVKFYLKVQGGQLGGDWQ